MTILNNTPPGAIINGNTKKLKDLKFVAFDLETTGLFPATSAILEVGAVKFDLQGNISRFESLVNPQCNIPDSSYEIHGIDLEMVQDQPLVGEVLPGFFEFIQDTVLIAHNAIFDVSFLSYNIMNLGLDFPANQVLDTRILAKSIISDAPDFKLGTLVKYFGLPNTVFHRAVFDAEYCRDVFLELIKMISPDGEMTLEELSEINKPLKFNIITQDRSKIDLPELYSPIREAISQSNKMQITYKKFDGEVSARDITPISFLKLKNKLYLEAFCHLRNEKRTFKLSKIVQFQNI